MSKKLSHYDESGAARMVDVSAKPETRRTARAHAFVYVRRAVLRKLPANPKGNPLEVWRNWCTDLSAAAVTSGHFLAEEKPRRHPRRADPVPCGQLGSVMSRRSPSPRKPSGHPRRRAVRKGPEGLRGEGRGESVGWLKRSPDPTRTKRKTGGEWDALALAGLRVSVCDRHG